MAGGTKRPPGARLRLVSVAGGQYVTVSDPLQDAIAELYAADPDGFIARRDQLAAAARSAGQAAAARQIAGLRKPTRAAWMVNLLARREQDLVVGLGDLGGQLRAAQRSLDGERIRELSGRRRALVEELTRKAIALSGEHAAPAVLRDEVSATLSAALADPEVAEQVAAGRLVRAVRREGFGEPGAVPLLVVPSPAGSGAGAGTAGRPPGGPATGAARGGAAGRGGAAAQGGTPQARLAAGRAERAQRGQRAGSGQRAEGAQRGAAEGARRGPAAERSRDAAARERLQAAVEARARAVRERHRAAVAVAERAVSDARQELSAAASDQEERLKAVRDLEAQLAQARRALAWATRRVRVAKATQRSAMADLDRLRAGPLSITDPPG